MAFYFLPGGNLTPNPILRTPAPEGHATVMLAWGALSDFESLCASVGRDSGR